MFQAQLVCSSCILIETSKTQATKICKTILPRERERERERENMILTSIKAGHEKGAVYYMYFWIVSLCHQGSV